MIATNHHKLKDVAKHPKKSLRSFADVHGEIQETHGNDDGYDIKTLATYQKKQNTSKYVANIS
jgi:hypothetical protein